MGSALVAPSVEVFQMQCIAATREVGPNIDFSFGRIMGAFLASRCHANTGVPSKLSKL